MNINTWICRILIIVIMTGCIQKKNVLSTNLWEYQLIDSTRGPNDLVPEWAWFGMDFADGNLDGFPDIIAGKWFYLNPGENQHLPWVRSVTKDSADNILLVNVDNDQFADVIALSCSTQYWLEAIDEAHTSWKVTIIGKEPICSHKMTAMGYCRADLDGDQVPEILISDQPGTIWCFSIPSRPDQMTLWPVVRLVDGVASPKFMAAGDIDGDGDPDMVSGAKPAGGKYFSEIRWFENPGSLIENWAANTIGLVNFTADHLAVADLDQDGYNDVLVTEGRSPEEYPAGIYLFRQISGTSGKSGWQKEHLITQYSTNSISIADLDQDGDPDFVTAEHKGPCRLQIWENDGTGKFQLHVIDSLKESHNGALLYDLEGDGDLDIATSGWYDYRRVHLWINKMIEN